MKPLAGETSIRGFLVAIAAADGVHGAVSAAAVSGGLGAALLAMVANIPKTRSDSLDDRAALVRAAAVLSDVQEQLLETIETETAVKIFTARNLPQASDAQRSERQAAIQFALRAAADVPLEVMRLCTRSLKHGETVASHSARAATADVQLGAALLNAAFNGARASLEGKLTSLTDMPHLTSIVDEIARLSDEATTAMRAVESLLRVRPD
jgi:methenyltetrahydrofolate cyclohydrolase